MVEMSKKKKSLHVRLLLNSTTLEGLMDSNLRDYGDIHF